MKHVRHIVAFLVVFTLAFGLLSLRGRTGSGREEPGEPLLDERFCSDVNGDGLVDISDAISLLQFLFVGGSAPYCTAQAVSLEDLFVGQGEFKAVVGRLEAVESAVGVASGSVPRRIRVEAGASPSESGQALLDALAAIDDASADNRYCIALGPGVFDLGSSSLRMKEFVDVEGCGEFTTRITGCGRPLPDGGTVIGANNAALRSLGVENRGLGAEGECETEGQQNHAIALYCDSTTPLLTHVRLVALQEKGGIAPFAYGAYSTGPIAGPRLISCFVIARGQPNSRNHGLHYREVAVGPLVERSFISARDGLTAIGIFCESSSVRLRECEVVGGAVGLRNVLIDEGTHRIRVSDSSITTTGGGTAIENAAGFTVELDDCRLASSLDVTGDGAVVRRGTLTEDLDDDGVRFDLCVSRRARFDIGDDWVEIGGKIRRSLPPNPPVPVFIDTSTGAYLTSGGAWTNASDRARKENFAAVDADEVLENLSCLPVEGWSYRREGANVRHVGASAQDFHAAFGLGDGGGGISTVDADGVSFLAIQALVRRLEAQTQRAHELESELASTRRELVDVSRRLTRLERLAVELRER